MSEQQEPDFRFSSELSYLGMLDEFRKAHVEQNDRLESFGSNIWFPDITASFPNFGNSQFSRKNAKDESLYINEESPEIQIFTRDDHADIRVNVPEINIIDEFPEAVCKYTLAFESVCTRLGLRPGVIQFNLGVTWITHEQLDEIPNALEAEIEFPVHP